jgi:subtilisin-like proprotein convertase family protein
MIAKLKNSWLHLSKTKRIVTDLNNLISRSRSIPLGLSRLEFYQRQILVFLRRNQPMSQIMSNAATATVTVELPTTTQAHTSYFLGNGGNIPDGMGSFQDDIVVTDNFSVTDVTVTLKGLVHTWVGDLSVRLRHLETETVVDLFRRPGQPHFSSSGYSNDLNGNYSFNDHFKGNFEETAAENAVIPSGDYSATEPLAAFNGLSAAGTWRLTINDCSAGDSGSLGSWSLDLG